MTQASTPGAPAEIRHLGGSQWMVQSFRGEDSFYTVDLHAGTCTCPHAQFKDPEGGCKHFRAAMEESRRMWMSKALAHSPSKLQAILREKGDRCRPDMKSGIEDALIVLAQSLALVGMDQVRAREYQPI